MLEYAVLIGAVTVAILVMSDYVSKAFNAHAKTVEVELNGTVDDPNKP